jgi:hypothetical protein
VRDQPVPRHTPVAFLRLRHRLVRAGLCSRGGGSPPFSARQPSWTLCTRRPAGNQLRRFQSTPPIQMGTRAVEEQDR